MGEAARAALPNSQTAEIITLPPDIKVLWRDSKIAAVDPASRLSEL